ncbi:MAG: replication initiation protein [Saprospiraceae bacterium]|nr:replication initiation protein [Saprospiraceae bacterium]
MSEIKKKNPTKNKTKGIALIKKSNNLIESRYNFDIWETRIFLMLLAQIRREDDDFQVYRIWYRDVAKVFKLNQKRGYSEIRDAVRKLLDKKFYVDTVVDGFKRKEIYHIIRKIGYLEEGQENKKGVENQEYIDVKIEDEMKPLLLQLQKSFTAYELANVTNLGVYAVRFYELLKQYESIGHRQLGFEELKTMFELEDKYPLFSGFFTFVVEPAVKEINEYTDLRIEEVEKIKEGKKIVALKFHFHKTTPKFIAEPAVILSDVPQNPNSSDYTERVKSERHRRFYAKVVESLGVTETVYTDLLKKYTDEQFEQAIRVTFRAKIEGQIKTNASGFFIQALKKGYTDIKEESLKKQKKENLKKQKEAIKATLQTEKDNKIFDRIRELTAAKPELTLQAIEAVKFTEGGRLMIAAEEKKLNRTLTIEDFRQIKPLRQLVIDALFVRNMEQFTDILTEYNDLLKQLGD